MTDSDSVPIVSWGEIIEPVLKRFNRKPLDQTICADILIDIREAIDSSDLEKLCRYLSKDPAYYIWNLQWAYFQRFKNIEPLDIYEEWARTKCDFLLAVARNTRDDDAIIQHLLNYEDFHVEVLPFSFGPQFIVDLYELRGLDFFLYHYMGGETDAHKDAALFENAESIVKALDRLGRKEESNAICSELVAKRKRMTEIGKEFQGPEYDPAVDLIGRMRIASERFWSEYLTSSVWVRLNERSRQELIDAFSTEYLLKKHVLSSWSAVALMLCKVVERELGQLLFIRWKEHFTSAHWNPPPIKSEKMKRRVESREMTFKTLQACAKGNPPTLGQLLFMVKFWNDELMDQCTIAFKNIRCEAEARDKHYSKKVSDIGELLEKPIVPGNQAIKVVELRNRSAHPREVDDIDWHLFIENLKEYLSKPPTQLLQHIVIGLTTQETIAQQ